MFRVNTYGNVICSAPGCTNEFIHLTAESLEDYPAELWTHLPAADRDRPRGIIHGECEAGHEFLILFGNHGGMTSHAVLYRETYWKKAWK